MVQLTHIIYYVKNVQNTVNFYEKAFSMKINFMHESGAYAELVAGPISLAFAQDALGAGNLPDGYYKNDLKALPAGCEIVFTTDDVDAVIKKALQEGAVTVVPAKQKPWGQTVAYVRDPEGILIEIASKM